MVCSIGNGRMAVMARLLAAGSLLQNNAGGISFAFSFPIEVSSIHVSSNVFAEEVSQQKLATQYICRELHEADEPNLLDEEDMHVFGLMPMTDPLDLVCCNACKKPVKASQYAAHADQATPVVGQESSEYIVADDTVASESQLDRPPRMPSSFSLDTKRNSATVDVASMIVGKAVSPENTDYSAGVMPPPTKRYKFISTEHRLQSDDPETASGLTKVTSTVDPSTYIPAPLATKVYYSQRNTRLRSAVAYLYHATSAEGLNMVNSELSQESIMQLLASSQKGSLDAQTNDLINEKGDPSVHQPDEILAQSSEMCLNNSGGCPPLTNFSNQFPVDNILRPQTASVGMLRSKYLSKPYSFAGNSGSLLISSTVTCKLCIFESARHDLSYCNCFLSFDDSVFVGQSLGTMQQPNGTVPVL
ncbi:hypothetical protein POTOM_037367 [Populus tomentosa]|uniref:Uncharacterized protein n=1 Tax=Populus tomentosa TaxID=118781 RepID=A0A8X7YUJ8_POPTO|nr:hypothetical protein POTOM_037367 [Populus tomentosa]